MIGKLLDRFRSGRGNEEAAPDSGTGGLEAPTAPAGKVDPFNVGLRDEHFGGWFDEDSGIIIEDFRIDAGDTVLDVGCGDGGHARFCAQRGAHVILADIDEPRLKEAARKLQNTPARKVETVVSDSNPLPLADNLADKIISSEVIEHVDDPHAVLKEMYRVGKPGAHYLLSAPDAAAERMQVGIAPQVYFEKPNHVRIIEPEELEQMVTDAGLVVEKRIPRSFYWNIWWMFFWICKQEAKAPWHPLLENWAATWDILIKMDRGDQVKAALDNSMPRMQFIIARKPH